MDQRQPTGIGDQEFPELSDRLLAGMALSQTPERQEAAHEIFDRLRAGDDVDHVKSLIDRMMQVVATQRHGQSPPDRKSSGGSGR